MTLQLAALPDDAFLLRTPRLTLRPLASDDAAQLWPSLRDPEIARYMSWHPHPSLEETRQFVSRAVARFQKREVVFWCVCRENAICGLFGIIDIKASHYALTYDSGEFSYWCARAEQGKGLMTEAGKALIAFAFDVLGLHKIRVEHRADNDRSKRMIERLGFRPIGIQREHYYKDGQWHNQHAYDLLVTEYAKEAHAQK